MKTNTPKFKPSPLQKKLLSAIGGIEEIISERDQAVEAMERLRKWEERPHGRRKSEMPSPRIQFEYVPSTEGWSTHWVMYWLVLPLSEYDIRREKDDEKPYDEWFIPVGETKISGGRNEDPPIYAGKASTPFRDGAHANFDMESLGLVLPVYATCEKVVTLIERPSEVAPPRPPAE